MPFENFKNQEKLQESFFFFLRMEKMQTVITGEKRQLFFFALLAPFGPKLATEVTEFVAGFLIFSPTNCLF